MSEPNTLFLRLEGPLQAWGDSSKFVIRRTMDAPTKSGVLGLICCAMGIKRPDACGKLRELNKLTMGVRIDRPGTLWSDYHTVGAKIGILRADGKGIKNTASTGEPETLITRRYYLCDASFLVALQGDADLIAKVAAKLGDPMWPVFLGRKSCPPSVPVVERRERRDGERTWVEPNPAHFTSLGEALRSEPWRPRLEYDERPPESKLDCLLEWRASATEPQAPSNAEVWHDTPVYFDPPVHQPRLVLRDKITVDIAEARQQPTPPPARLSANYNDKQYKKRRLNRLADDHQLCIFCKAEAATVQHITYRHVGTDEEEKDLRSLCRLCHDAVTMIEYGLGMGLDRINPEEPQWRDRIIQKRDEIIRFRSLETRRRRLEPEEVE